MGIIEVIGCVRAKTFVGTLVPQNRAFGYQNAPVSHHFACWGVAKCSKPLPNISLALIEAIWVCSCENIRRKFDTPKPCIPVLKRTSFSSFCTHSCSKMLQNTNKHHFCSNGGYWLCSYGNIPRNFSTTKPCIRVLKRLSFSSFRFIRVAKGSKILPNIIMGLMEAIGCVRTKTFVRSLIPRNRPFEYRNAPVSHRFIFIRVEKCSKILQTSFCV